MSRKNPTLNDYNTFSNRIQVDIKFTSKIIEKNKYKKYLYTHFPKLKLVVSISKDDVNVGRINEKDRKRKKHKNVVEFTVLLKFLKRLLWKIAIFINITLNESFCICIYIQASCNILNIICRR